MLSLGLAFQNSTGHKDIFCFEKVQRWGGEERYQQQDEWFES
jgi:hypothetical protein